MKYVKQYPYLLLFLIMLIALFLRFYQLGSIPKGLYTDETAIGYNAYSLLQTGNDEHGIHMPLYFQSFNDYKLPGYIYLTVISEKLFGVNAFAVRFASAFFGTLCVLALFFVVKLIGKRMDFSLLASFLLAINPWHVFFSRAGYEVNVATAFTLFGFLFFTLALQKKNNFLLFLLSLLLFIVSLYTYNVSRIFVPVFLFVLILFYREKLKTISLMQKVSFLLLFFLLFLPILITLRYHSGLSGQTNVLIVGSDMRAKFVEMRSYAIGLPSLFTKLFLNIWVLTVWQYLKNLVGFFSFPFFFIQGANDALYSTGTVGSFYLFELPCIFVGLYVGVWKKVRFLYPFYIWLLVAILVGSLIKEVPHATRDYKVLIPLVVFSAYGMIFIFEKIKKCKRSLLKNGYMIGFGVVCSYAVIYFFISYFYRFPIENAKAWRSVDQPFALFLKSQEKKYAHIYIDTDADVGYTSLLFYDLYSPSKFQKEANYISDGLLVKAQSFGKYSIINITDADLLKNKNSLFVVNGKTDLTIPFRILKQFSYPARPVVFSDKGKIFQYPVADIAYIVFEGPHDK